MERDGIEEEYAEITMVVSETVLEIYCIGYFLEGDPIEDTYKWKYGDSTRYPYFLVR